MSARLQVIITFYIFIFPHPPQVNKSQTHTPIVCRQNRSRWGGMSLVLDMIWARQQQMRVVCPVQNSHHLKWRARVLHIHTVSWFSAACGLTAETGLNWSGRACFRRCGWCLWSVVRELAAVLSSARFVSFGRERNSTAANLHIHVFVQPWTRTRDVE